MKAKDIIILGGITAGAFYLSNKSEDRGGLFGGFNLPNIGSQTPDINIRDLFGGFNLPQVTQPDLFGGFNLPQVTQPDFTAIDEAIAERTARIKEWAGMWGSSWPSINPPEMPGSSSFPDSGMGGSSWGMTGGSLFTSISPSLVQNLVGRGGTLYARQISGAALTGRHFIKPLPFARAAEVGGAGFRGFAKAVSQSPFTKTWLKKPLTETFKHSITGQPVVRLTERGLGKAGALIGAKTAPKVALKMGLRAVPYLGWGLLGVDVGADIARLFGFNVTEWLGVSGLIEPIIGYNPLEKWVSDESEKVAGIAPAAGTGYSGGRTEQGKQADNFDELSNSQKTHSYYAGLQIEKFGEEVYAY